MYSILSSRLSLFRSRSFNFYNIRCYSNHLKNSQQSFTGKGPQTEQHDQIDLSKQTKYMEWLKQKLEIKSFEDWYHVTQKDILQNKGNSILSQNNNSIFNLIKTTYPNYDWLPWKFHGQKHFWRDENNKKEYMYWLGKKLKFESMEDWYKLRKEDLINNDGKSLLRLNNNSIPNLVTTTYPDYNWLPWKFSRVSSNYWFEPKNIHQYMEWLGQKLNIKQMEDWYQLSPEDLIENNGSSLLRYNDYSVKLVVKKAYPDYLWDSWSFKHSPKGYQNEIEFQKEYLNNVGKILNIKQLDDWYQIGYEELRKHARPLIDRYPTIYDLLKTIYPEHNWNIYQFPKLPDNYAKQLLKDPELQKEFVSYLKKKFNITQTDDWYSITSAQMRKIIRLKSSDWMRIVKNFYPDLDLIKMENEGKVGTIKPANALETPATNPANALETPLEK